jgi:hypothetical protein
MAYIHKNTSYINVLNKPEHPRPAEMGNALSIKNFQKGVLLYSTAIMYGYNSLKTAREQYLYEEEDRIRGIYTSRFVPFLVVDLIDIKHPLGDYIICQILVEETNLWVNLVEVPAKCFYRLD